MAQRGALEPPVGDLPLAVVTPDPADLGGWGPSPEGYVNAWGMPTFSVPGTGTTTAAPAVATPAAVVITTPAPAVPAVITTPAPAVPAVATAAPAVAATVTPTSAAPADPTTTTHVSVEESVVAEPGRTRVIDGQPGESSPKREDTQLQEADQRSQGEEMLCRESERKPGRGERGPRSHKKHRSARSSHGSPHSEPSSGEKRRLVQEEREEAAKHQRIMASAILKISEQMAAIQAKIDGSIVTPRRSPGPEIPQGELPCRETANPPSAEEGQGSSGADRGESSVEELGSDSTHEYPRGQVRILGKGVNMCVGCGRELRQNVSESEMEDGEPMRWSGCHCEFWVCGPCDRDRPSILQIHVGSDNHLLGGGDSVQHGFWMGNILSTFLPPNLPLKPPSLFFLSHFFPDFARDQQNLHLQSL